MKIETVKHAFLPLHLCAELSKWTGPWASAPPTESETSFHWSRAGISPLQTGFGRCEMSAAALPAGRSGEGLVRRRQRLQWCQEVSMNHVLLSVSQLSCPAVASGECSRPGCLGARGSGSALPQGPARLFLPCGTGKPPLLQRVGRSSVCHPHCTAAGWARAEAAASTVAVAFSRPQQQVFKIAA